MDEIKAYREKKEEERILRDYVNIISARSTTALEKVIARVKGLYY